MIFFNEMLLLGHSSKCEASVKLTAVTAAQGAKKPSNTHWNTWAIGWLPTNRFLRVWSFLFTFFHGTTWPPSRCFSSKLSLGKSVTEGLSLARKNECLPLPPCAAEVVWDFWRKESETTQAWIGLGWKSFFCGRLKHFFFVEAQEICASESSRFFCFSSSPPRSAVSKILCFGWRRPFARRVSSGSEGGGSWWKRTRNRRLSKKPAGVFWCFLHVCLKALYCRALLGCIWFCLPSRLLAIYYIRGLDTFLLWLCFGKPNVLGCLCYDNSIL